MKLVLCVLASVSAGEIQDVVELVNNHPSATWTAHDSGRFGSFEDAKALCGTFLKGHPQYKAANLPIYQAPATDFPLADSLDLRISQPNCTIIGKIRDQSACGSCWAFGSTESFQDRRCISGSGDVEFSALDTAENGNLDANGCKGGQPGLAFKWMVKTGVVTGGDFADVSKGTSCMPYPFAPCAHHSASTKYANCSKVENRLTRQTDCTDKTYSKSYKSDKMKSAHATACKDKDIKCAMQALPKGTISTTFTVYEDFLVYKSGVYKHLTGKMLGGHAVAFIGYGTDPTGGDYWLVKNSWNAEWGDGGTFKIARGTDEAGIEQEMAFVDF